MKVVSLSLQNEPEQARLAIRANGLTYLFEPNDDQLMVLLHQISHVLYASCRQVRRFPQREYRPVSDRSATTRVG